MAFRDLKTLEMLMANDSGLLADLILRIFDVKAKQMAECLEASMKWRLYHQGL